MTFLLQFLTFAQRNRGSNKVRPSQRNRRRLSPRRRFRHLVLEKLEVRAMLAGIIEFGPSDNIALDQPRVAMELIKDGQPGRFEAGTEAPGRT